MHNEVVVTKDLRINIHMKNIQNPVESKINTYSPHWEQPAKLLYSFGLPLETFGCSCHLPIEYKPFSFKAQAGTHKSWIIKQCLDTRIKSNKKQRGVC
jgi:hypothetical protein